MKTIIIWLILTSPTSQDKIPLKDQFPTLDKCREEIIARHFENPQQSTRCVAIEVPAKP